MTLHESTTYRVQLGQLSGTVVATSGVITDAAPAFQKFLGARMARFKAWVERRGGTVIRVQKYVNAQAGVKVPGCGI